MKNIVKALLITTILFLVHHQAMAFYLPERYLRLGSPIYIEEVNEEKFYAVFLPFEDPTSGEVCAIMTGEELIEDNNLKNYGTCFINDEGTFTLIEIEEPFSSSYKSLLENEEIIQEGKITLVSLDPEENSAEVVTDLDKFIQSAEDEIDRILSDLDELKESTESTSSETSILGSRTTNILVLISENPTLSSLLFLLIITITLLVFVILKKWDKKKRKKK